MKQWVMFSQRIGGILFGLFLCGLGFYFSIQANIGLAPWDAFNMGCSNVTGISYGNVSVLSGLIILAVDVLMHEKIGVGTILNTLIIGKVVDLLQWIDFLPRQENFFIGVAMLLLGQELICIGTYFYIRGGLGGGPRDSLMVAIGKRLPRIPVGAIRGAIEATVLLIGWLMGAKVGLGTVIAVFGISFLLESTFRLFRFDVKSLRHETVVQTILRLKAGDWGKEETEAA